MKKAIIVGAGAGGAAAAKRLQGHFDVTVLEAGHAFRPFAVSPKLLERFKWTGLFFDEREIGLLFPAMQVRHSDGGIVLVNGKGPGGTTTLTAGNGLRMDAGLKAIGIDLTEEFDALEAEIPITADHRDKWSDVSGQLFDICRTMALDPSPLPKMGEYRQCVRCGRCVLGCPHGVKWDSRRFLADAEEQGARILEGCRVDRVVIEGGRAAGVITHKGFQAADVVVLAAGGFSTPVILGNSGIACEKTLFVDPVLCVSARYPGARMNRELSMPFAVQRPGYIVSPYFDYLSFFFNKDWRPSAADTLTLMIKLADASAGSVEGRRIDKRLTGQDLETLREASELCAAILARLGIQEDELFFGTLNAGHPGGMLPLSPDPNAGFHDRRLPENLYVADASILPASAGNPPSLTIMALAYRISKVIIDRFA